jgi:tRNA pseudouridine32 synthase/23S rRNA pseudouridine746 synthase
VPDGVTVLHADDALLVLDKPAGLLSVPGRGPDNADCLSARVQALYPDALVVHRLDMGTSGLIVLARGAAAQSVLSRAFAQREVHKRYQALVSGLPDASGADAQGWSDIDLPLIVDWPNRPKSKVCLETGKPSRTRWRLLGQEQAGGLVAARLELEPVTGRSHQLRLHLQAIGHPILGDELYADDAALDSAPRLLLHACAIELPHPGSGAGMRFEAPPPF